MVDVDYWDNFYKTQGAPREGSTFAQSVKDLIDKNGILFELGCGNGRDAFYFAQNGIKVWASDIASTVEDLNQQTRDGNPRFIYGDFTNLQSPFQADTQFGAVYSRFTLHSVKEEGASRALRWSYENLKAGGLLLIEVRSVKDPMCGKGTKVEGEKDAWINTHYRRFLRKDELLAEIKSLGFTVEYELEADNIAVYKDDNPVVIRVHARKPE